MTKKIWIFNHYATGMFLDKGGRHYEFAKNLIELGYQTTIFCASTIHNSNNEIDMNGEKSRIVIQDQIPFVFIKTPKYDGNGLGRIYNFLTFYISLFRVAKEYANKNGKPACILASSVHPLTLVAGIKIAKKFGIPCICEVRDLWPESLVAYGILKQNNLFTKLLYKGEKWIYKHAHQLIFTMEGGKDYIIERSWDLDSGGPIDIKKVHHINNGVDLLAFQQNAIKNTIDDPHLNNEEVFKVVYAGSIRKANNVRKIVDIAERIQKKQPTNIQFLIYGDGPDKEPLKRYCKTNGITNCLFKGLVEKNQVPYVLSKSNLNVVQLFDQNPLKHYGTSLNKMFEYFASGKPTISDCEYGYDLIKKYNCGVVIDQATVDQLADEIIKIANMPKEQYEIYCQNAKTAARDYDFKVLTRKLEQIICK